MVIGIFVLGIRTRSETQKQHEPIYLHFKQRKLELFLIAITFILIKLQINNNITYFLQSEYQSINMATTYPQMQGANTHQSSLYYGDAQNLGNSQMSGGDGGNSSGLGPAPAETPDPTERGARHRGPFDQDFVDIDPCLKSLKAGHLMQRTYFNTNLGGSSMGPISAKARVTSLTTRNKFNQSKTIDVSGGDATTEAASSRTALQKLTRLGAAMAQGGATAGGPSCNYQNVDLFKIPDVVRLGKKHRRQKSQRLTDIENFTTIQPVRASPRHKQFLDAESHSDLGIPDSNISEVDPDQIIKEAIQDARFNRNVKMQQIQLTTNMSTNRHRATTDMYSAFNVSNQSPTFRNPNQQQLLTGPSNQGYNNTFGSPKHSDVSFPTTKPGYVGHINKDSQLGSRKNIEQQQRLTNLSIIENENRQPYNLNGTMIGFGSAVVDKEENTHSYISRPRHDLNVSSTSFTKPNHNFNQTVHFDDAPKSIPNGHALRVKGRNNHHGQSQRLPQQSLDAIEEQRRTPILHMQFDEIATTQLHATFANRFVKVDPLQRRNPIKYMRNPKRVFGMTQGAMHYTWRENEPPLKSQLARGAEQLFNSVSGINETQNDMKAFATIDMRGRSTQQSSAFEIHKTVAGHQTVFGSTFGATQRSNRSKNSDEEVDARNNQKGDIKVLNLAKNSIDGQGETNVLDPVPQISGRGISVSPPKDRPYVVNNVVRPFRATSEVDRQRATQILDYIIERRKMAGKKQEVLDEQNIEAETSALLKQIEEDKRMQYQARSRLSSGGGQIPENGSENFDEFEKDDKYGAVLQKDLDRLTGGMQVVKESYLDLDNIERMVATPEEGNRPTQGKQPFLVDQLERNEWFKTDVNARDARIQKILETHPAIKKYDLKDKINETMLEMSPVRKARVEVEQKKMQKKTGVVNPVSILSNKRGSMGGTGVIDLRTNILDSYDRTLMDGPKPVARFKTDTSKDIFSGMNKTLWDKKIKGQQTRRERIKDYERFLFYDGVAALPKSEKRIYKFDKAREAEREMRNERSTSRNKQPSPLNMQEGKSAIVLTAQLSYTTGPIQEQNEQNTTGLNDSSITPVTRGKSDNDI